MTLSSLPLGLVLLLVTTTTTTALQVTPGSSCSSVCGDSSATNPSDIVCNDFDYYASATGSTFMTCIECLQTSNSTSDSENDVSWFLYNLRYASAVCLYDFPAHDDANATSTCDLEYACAPLQGSLEYGSLVPSNETEFGYCQADSDAFYGTSINGCVSCLQSSPSTYTANFLLALEAGCQQEPSAGTLLSISGSLFSTTAINITAPSSSTTTTTITTSSASSSSSSSSNDRVLSVTAIVGIVVGLGVLFVLATGLFTLYCCLQRRHAREDAGLNNPYPSRRLPFYYSSNHKGSGPPSLSTGQSYAMPHYTVDYKSQLAPAHPFGDEGGSGPEPPVEAVRYAKDGEFASNAEYYDRQEGRSRGLPLQAHPVRLMNVTTTTNNNGHHAGAAVSSSDVDAIGNLPAHALPTHPAYIPRDTTPTQQLLGGRASRNVSRSASTRSGASSMAERQQQQQRRRQRQDKAPSYAMEVYLDGKEEPEPRPEPEADRARAPTRSSGNTPRNIQVELAANPPRTSLEQQQPQQGPSVPPPVVSWRSRRASVSPPPSQERRQVAPPDRSATATPAMSALILPSVPRIRVPGRKPPKLKITDPTGEDHEGDGTGGPVGISGPLAFPDSRFSMRPPNDRIIEQTIDRSGGRVVEVPIGSGKSYLYG